MDRPSALTVLALAAIAMAAGGAGVRIVALIGRPAPVATLGAAAFLVLAVLLLAGNGTGRTPYWP